MAVAEQESGLDPQAVGDNGKSLGLFQLQRAAAIDAGIDPDRRQDLDANIRGGVTYFKQKLAQSKGNIPEALSRYNRGGPTYKGIGDPHYEKHVTAKYNTQSAAVQALAPAPEKSLLARLSAAVTPREASAAETGGLAPGQARPGAADPRDALGERLFGPKPTRQAASPAASPAEGAAASTTGDPRDALGVRLFGPKPTAPAAETFPPLAEQEAAATQQALYGTPAGQTKDAYDVDVRSLTAAEAERLRAGAPAAPAPAAPTAQTQVELLRQQEAGRLKAEREVGSPTVPAATARLEAGKTAAATVIGTAGSIIGTGAGILVAPFTGPFAPAMPLVGEMAGSYGARKLNVTLGLEEPGALGDVASVAIPGLFGLRGAIRGIKAGGKIATVPAKAQEMVKASGETGIPLTYGEATGSPIAQRAETYLEQVPVVGTGGFRTRQQAAVKTAAQTQVQAQQQAMMQAPWNGLAQVKAAAAQGSKQAQRVLDDIAGSGEDWNRIVQASGNLKAYRSRQIAGTLYGKVSELADGLGNVPMTKTIATIDDTLKALRTAVVPDTETIRYLEQLKGGLQGQTSTTVSPLLDASGNPITRTVQVPGKTTYGQLRQLRSDLGDTISDYYKGSNAVVGAKGVGSLAKVRSALDQDLDTFALQSPNPELAAAAQRADQFYKRQVIPYEDQQLAKALTSDTPDEIYGKFIQRDHRDRAKKFYDALDTRGKAAVQYGMVAEAQHKALDPTTGVFSPAKFEGSLKAIQDARGVFFKGEAAFKLDGLMKVMRAAERAGQYAENPPTGQRVIGAALGTGAVMAPLATAKLLGTATVLSWALTSKTGTKLLLRAHSVAEQSLAFEQVMRELTAQGARVMATEGGEGLQEGQQVQVQPGRVGR